MLVIGDDDGLPRAFLNTCRHRGARLVDEPEGQLRRLQCPYHAWSYGFDGSLRNAPFTEGLTDFDPACFALHEVRLAVVEGLVLLDLSVRRRRRRTTSGTSPAHGRLPAAGAQARRADRLRGRRELEGDRRELQRVPALPGVHPELNRLSHYLTGETYEGAGLWRGG